MDDKAFMRLAIEEAMKARHQDEVPVGAVIVKDGEVIAKAHNHKERLNLATAHAEMLVIRKASEVLGSWHLEDCTLYVTLEPCMMCTGAIVLSRIKKVVIGARENRWPGLVTLLHDHNFNHEPMIAFGPFHDECSYILTQYFKSKRESS